MSWWLLLGAGVAEIAMGTALKLSGGWSRSLPSIAGVVFGLGSIFLLTLALRHLPVGTAYVIWTGIGAVGIAAIGIAWFGEPASPARLLCIALIVAGMAGLRWLENH